MALHPVLAKLVQKARDAGLPTPSQSTPEAARALVAQMSLALGSGIPVGSCTDVQIPTRSGAIAAKLLLPETRPLGLLTYLHGGGWVLAHPSDYEVLARSLVAQSGCALLLPDYRLAPEHPFPAALEDCEDSLRWSWAERERVLGHAGPLIVAGDSAGANLATVAASTLRNEVALSGQVLIYPVADCDFERPSYRAYGTGLPLTRDDMEWFFRHYAPEPLWADPRIAPVHAPDLQGLPQTVVITAENDVLRDEGEAYAAQLEAAGVPVTLRRYPGMTHGFIRLHDMVDTAGAAVRDLTADIRRLCAAPAATASAA